VNKSRRSYVRGTLTKGIQRDSLAPEATKPKDVPALVQIRGGHELAELVRLVRFTPGQASGFLHSEYDAEQLLWRWALKWFVPRAQLEQAQRDQYPPDGTCLQCGALNARGGIIADDNPNRVLMCDACAQQTADFYGRARAIKRAEQAEVQLEQAQAENVAAEQKQREEYRRGWNNGLRHLASATKKVLSPEAIADLVTVLSLPGESALTGPPPETGKS
jgi:hypothetical protein